MAARLTMHSSRAMMATEALDDAFALRREEPADEGAAAHPSAMRPKALAFEDVYRENVDFVWRSLRRLGLREADVEDAMQDVFVVVHGKLATFEGRSRLSTWLYGICLRVAHARRRRAHVRLEVGEEEASEPVMHANQEARAEEGERLALLDEALDALPLEQRAVFTLFELDGLSTQAIAELVDIPIGTVYSRLRLAREGFRRAAARIQARTSFPTKEGL